MIVPTAASETTFWNHGSWCRCADYRSWKQALSRRLTQHVVACCPELKELIPLDLATPLTLRDYSRAPQGAIYGVGRVLGQYSPQPATRLPGLYLSGQAVAGPGLLGAITAAYFTCGTLLGHELLRGELRTCR